MKKYLYVLLGLALVAGFAVAQQKETPVAKDPNGALQIIRSDTNGNQTTQAPLCANPVHQTGSVGSSTVVNCPPAQLAGRRFVIICNSAENTGSPTLKVRIDGVAPVNGTGNSGDVYTINNCGRYYIGSSVVPQCIASAGSTFWTSLECQ